MKHLVSIAAFVVLFLIAAFAQQPQNAPRVGYVYPAGGQQGTTFRVKIGGRFLDGAAGVLVSGSGVTAKVVDYDKPLTGQQITELREKLQELQKQGNRAELQKQLADTRLKIGDAVRRNANPGLAELVTIEVTIDRDAQPGARQIRLQAALGLTNPLVFVVGQLPEFRENEVKNSPADSELAITLPAVVNGRMIPGDVDRVRAPLRAPAGQYMPGDVDRYRFHARKGDNLVAVASARALMPYLADAVPGWFQATLTLRDAAGHELAYEDDYRFEPDPVLHCQIPDDGDYVLEIEDALYRGREDFVYRIAIGELPFITAIFPLGGRLGDRPTVDVSGWNLRVAKVTMDGKAGQPGIYPLTVHSGALASNHVPFALDTLPETFEREPNNSPKGAQRVKLPVVVNGRIGRPGDTDVFSFAGRAGEEVVAEVTARRLGSPLDSTLELTDAAGRRVAFNDDREDKAAGLLTHQADSSLTAKLPATATYFVRIADAQHKGGSEYGYRLRVSAPQPDFKLFIAPSAVNATSSASIPVTVYAVRRDGFSGDIALSLKDAPNGFQLAGGVVPAGQDSVRMTITAPVVNTRAALGVAAPAGQGFTLAGGEAAGAALSLRVEGRAAIHGQTVVRAALPADEMMQAFAYKHLVPADDLRVAITGRGGTRVPAAVVSAQPVKIPAGGNARVRVALPPGWLTFENIRFELNEPPEGLSLGEVRVDGVEFVLQADATKLKPGVRGNLIVTVSGERAGRGNQAAPAARRRIPIGALPAISFEIVPP